jgi:putative aminopeptidase FrvX
MKRLWLPIALLASLACPAAAQDRVVTMLAELVNAPGAPGFEDSVRHLMVDYMKPMATRLTYDGIGSVIAQQGTAGPRIMVDAHMDELGGVVRRVTPTGFLSMQMLGGWFDQALVDQRWVIIGSKGPVHAVTGIRDIHIAAPEERTRVFPRESIFLDVGATNDAQVKAMGISPGDPVVPDAPFTVLNGTNNYLAKAWDDRIGLAVLIEVMRRLEHTSHANTIYYAATVQEEIGLRGGQTAAAIVKPDIGIALEAGVVKDVPGVQAEEAQETLGGGPGVFLYDASALPSRKLVAFVKETAAAASIPLQFDFITGYGEDGAAIQKTDGGAPIVNLVIPTRYTHAHNGIINRADFDHMVDLVTAMVTKLDAPAVARLRDYAPAP